MAEVVVELLTKAHDRKPFDCGATAQNEFLQQRARKHAELNYSKTWVAVEGASNRILGFVTLSMSSIDFESLDEKIRKRLPRYPMPVLHVGQLATDVQYQDRGIGALLLRFAAEKAIELSATVGCHAIELVADNKRALDYYLRRGFVQLAKGSSRLYMLIDTVKAGAGPDRL